ncbi:MAG: glycogen synthase [Nitrospirales bacterium]|nr:MAG: glycogen synthase [Nitrospirales bacterium]
MKALLLSNEYPPYNYGGAGVHVEYLSQELAKLMHVEVRCFGDQKITEPNLEVRGFELNNSEYGCPESLTPVFGAMQRGLDFNSFGIDASLVHCHTWYTHLAGILAKLNYGIPLVITTHSLEPLRPWKREQLGGGYDYSLWLERTALEMADAVIAVSHGTQQDILHHFSIAQEKVKVIHNGIDLTEYTKQTSTKTLVRYGVDPAKPYVLFVGRITRQKGIIHLVQAIEYLNPDFQVVLCAGAPDTPDIEAEMHRAVQDASRNRQGVIWIREMLDKPSVIEFYSHAAVFCCPSIYEPFGIINLEAMACETAIVASAVGGIPEVVVDGETGKLVPLEQHQESPFAPVNPRQFSEDLAAAINELMANQDQRERYAKAGRARAEDLFSWTAIARQTKTLYEHLLARQ